VLVALLLGSTAARVAAAPDIVNGVLTSEYPSVGILLGGGNFATANLTCTGTLIGCRTFLTAAHCVEGDLDPNNYSVFFQHAGFFAVSDIVVHPSYAFPVGDLAVVTLATTVDGVAPSPINTTAAPTAGTDATIVGFGRSGGSAYDYGLKRTGAVVTTACPLGISGTTSVCWTFANPIGPPGSDANTCNGDSGGPLFVDVGSGATVAGVTSGGSSESCLPTDESYDANVHTYHTWIATAAGADLHNTTCGTLPQAGGAGTAVQAATGSLNTGAPQATHTVTVQPGTAELRVALNAVDDGSDFDLYVRAAAPPTTTSYDCKADGSSPYGFCRFVAPAAGTWHILVNRFSGAGLYQATATTFGIDCSLPANAGAGCDDGSACTTYDSCVAGACVGTPAADGVPCDDGALCTHGDACQAGACIGSASPRSGCRTAVVSGRGTIDLKQQTGRPQKLSWKWGGGGATTLADLGDPVIATSYALCLYDHVGGSPQLVFAQVLPGGQSCGPRPCWSGSTAGFAYRDPKAIAGSITSLLLRTGTDGKARITAKGKGDLLGLPALPFSQQPSVTVQLTNGTTCWESRYTTNSENDGTTFRARQ